MEVPWACHGCAIEVPLKCRWSANIQQPTAKDIDLPLLTPSLQNALFNYLGGKNDPPPLIKWVITGQYKAYILQPQVSTTPGSGCFATSQKCILADIAMLSVKILGRKYFPRIFFFRKWSYKISRIDISLSFYVPDNCLWSFSSQLLAHYCAI